MAERMTSEKRTVLSLAVLASFVVFLDGSVVNVALPAITADVGGGLVVQQWIVDAYLITLGSLILVAGSLSDVFGQVRVMRYGLIGFAAASVAIGCAPTPELVVIMRGVQGIAGALLVPSSLALITSTFRDEERGRAIGVWTSLTSGAMIVGPMLGGLFVDLGLWRGIFFINVFPVGVALFLLAGLRRVDVRAPGSAVDYLGAVLCAAGLGGVVFALIELPRLGADNPAIFVPAVVGVLALAGFVWRQAAITYPLMPLDLFRVRNFWTGNIATVFIYAALSLSGFVIVVYLQQEAGVSALEAGLSMLPVTILMILFSSRVGRLSGRYGPRFFMTVGPLVSAAGTLLMLGIRPDYSYWTQLLPGVVLFGVGLTLTVAPLTSAILGSIDTGRSGIASAVNNAVSRIAGLVITAMLGVIVGERLDLAGFGRSLIVCAVLLAAGGIVSFLGIRTPRLSETSPVSGPSEKPRQD
ncbi:MFS transporter [Klugiella xanthotipulae]|uniref:EmrB/QacA subfamily drug resistance transporter n=1 Tax=Klugiella xanthotipulae TaxID=244735 RepID=A0A543I6S4_9MICO|nr:MFS transporter [Klugiella xanthotipulae]TQM66251.1 EmrB/QacA subfamily drug resistance transporter [Klugiella xanthotipulae]